MNKTEVKKLLVAERKTMRVKQRQSAFLRKTNSIYQGMKRRAAEAGSSLDFDIDWLRGLVWRRLGSMCDYCLTTLVVVNFCIDHCVPISRGGAFSNYNLAVCCKPCNFQKGGVMTRDEFIELKEFLNGQRPEVAADVKRRLTIGGRWAKAYGAK